MRTEVLLYDPAVTGLGELFVKGRWKVIFMLNIDNSKEPKYNADIHSMVIQPIPINVNVHYSLSFVESDEIWTYLYAQIW